jgi:hypothetical protein
MIHQIKSSLSKVFFSFSTRVYLFIYYFLFFVLQKRGSLVLYQLNLCLYSAEGCVEFFILKIMRNILRSAVAKVKESWFEFVAWKRFVFPLILVLNTNSIQVCFTFHDFKMVLNSINMPFKN